MPIPFILGLAAAAAGAGAIKSQIEKSKATNAILEEAETICRAEAMKPKVQRTESELQKKMNKLLFDHAFSSELRSAQPPISSDWPHIPKHIRSVAAKKYSLMSWGEYAFYTFEGIYYHNKKKGIHEFLFYDNINAFDPDTEIVDYGSSHQKRDISQWEAFERGFVKQIGHIRAMDSEYDTSVLNFCFNWCEDFKTGLRYFRDRDVSAAFKRQFQRLCTPKVIRENFEHITINEMKDGKIELQFWAYFPMVENVIFSEDDTDEQIREKEWLQEQREREAEEYQWKMQDAFEDLAQLKEDIAALYQAGIYDLYGVMFAKENIVFLDEPSFTFEGPSVIDRINNAAASAKAFIDDYADKHDLRK